MALPIMEPWRMENPPARLEMLSFFRGEDFHAHRVPSLCRIAYPAFTRTVVGEIASAQAVGFDIVLLSFLASIAVADRGKHRVVLSNGSENSLSLIMHVGAESGAGKGRALEESLNFFRQWEKTACQKIEEENKTRAGKNELTLARIAALKRIYSKGFDPEIAEQILAERAHLLEPLRCPHFLLNDVTAPAYMQELVEYGVATRLESDGMPLPAETMRIVNKAWSGESCRRTRLTMPDGVVHDPFVVDLVMTQPEFFHRHISDPDAVASGRLARTLVYLYDNADFVPQQPAHELNSEIRKLFYDKLSELLRYSETESQTKTLILVERDAEQLFHDANRTWHEQCHHDGYLYKVKDFGERMGQHALRLAGILHLAEHQIDSSIKINAETIQIAINMTEIFASHTFAYRIKDYGDFNKRCCCDIMLFVLENNFFEVPEVVIKQALRKKYKAADVEGALYYLQQSGHLYPAHENPFRPKQVGRPKGRIFRNPYLEPGDYPY